MYKCRSCFGVGMDSSQKQKERQTVDINAGRLVTADVQVCGNSPSIASVYPAKYKAKGFSVVGKEISKEKRAYEIVLRKGRVTD